MKENIEIIIITQGVSPIIEPIVENYKICGIIESAPRNYKRISGIKKFIKNLILILRNNSLNQFCNKRNIPYYFMTTSDKKLEEWVKSKKPDVIIVYSMSQLLKENIFTIPKYGSLNLHPALLPKYRGPNPWFWHYFNMQQEFGITLHFVNKGEDTGDIVYQEKIEVPLGTKQQTLRKILIDGIGVSLIFKALENIKNLPRKTQPKDSPTIRAKNILKDEYKALIDFKWNIERIWHFLRGSEDLFNIYFDESFFFKIKSWEVLDFEKCDTSRFEIGKIYKNNSKYFLVCKDGKVYLKSKFSLKKFIKVILP